MQARTQTAQAATPAPHPARHFPPRHLPEPEQAAPGTSLGSGAKCPCPGTVLRAIPRLSLVRPLLCPQSVGRFIEAARQGQAQKKRTRKVAASLLEALRLPTSASAEELTQTLEQRFPMPDCEVMIRASSRHLEFEFCWSSQGAYELGFLGELTRRIDPDWLPGVISALERWTAHAGPVLGPKSGKPRGLLVEP